MNPSKRYNKKRATLDDLMRSEFNGVITPNIISEEIYKAAQARNFARKVMFNSIYGSAGMISKKKKVRRPFNPSRRER